MKIEEIVGNVEDLSVKRILIKSFIRKGYSYY